MPGVPETDYFERVDLLDAKVGQSEPHRNRCG
jgi:hypothetical protein